MQGQYTTHASMQRHAAQLDMQGHATHISCRGQYTTHSMQGQTCSTQLMQACRDMQLNSVQYKTHASMHMTDMQHNLVYSCKHAGTDVQYTTHASMQTCPTTRYTHASMQGQMCSIQLMKACRHAAQLGILMQACRDRRAVYNSCKHAETCSTTRYSTGTEYSNSCKHAQTCSTTRYILMQACMQGQTCSIQLMQACRDRYTCSILTHASMHRHAAQLGIYIYSCKHAGADVQYTTHASMQGQTYIQLMQACIQCIHNSCRDSTQACSTGQLMHRHAAQLSMQV